MSAFPLLSRSLSRQMFNNLIELLPPLADDSIEALIARDGAALAHLDALGPIRSAEEASLAITVVASDTHAHDALRSAARNAGDLKIVMQCRSQAMMMLRSRTRAVERLERLQREYGVEAVLADIASAETAAHDERKAAMPIGPDSGAEGQVDPPWAAPTDIPMTAAEPPPPPPPLEPMSREERDWKRAAVTAIYAGLAGRKVQAITNEPGAIVSAAEPRVMRRGDGIASQMGPAAAAVHAPISDTARAGAPAPNPAIPEVTIPSPAIITTRIAPSSILHAA